MGWSAERGAIVGAAPGLTWPLTLGPRSGGAPGAMCFWRRGRGGRSAKCDRRERLRSVQAGAPGPSAREAREREAARLE